jgi:hypothetical protein
MESLRVYFLLHHHVPFCLEGIFSSMVDVLYRDDPSITTVEHAFDALAWGKYEREILHNRAATQPILGRDMVNLLGVFANIVFTDK